MLAYATMQHQLVNKGTLLTNDNADPGAYARPFLNKTQRMLLSLLSWIKNDMRLSQCEEAAQRLKNQHGSHCGEGYVKTNLM